MPVFTTSDGLSLYFEESGTGQPLLCLAGLTRNCRDFDALAPLVSNARLIAMDYRGRGKSDHDPDHRNYNIVREGQDALELLDHLGVGRATVLGTSRGGLIAMLLAATQSARLSGVILNDVGPVLDPGGLAVIMEYVGRAPMSKTHDQAAQGLAAFMAADFPGVPMPVWLRLARAQYEATDTGLALRYDPALRTALIEQAAAGPAPDLWPMFEALHGIPTGVIRGGNSNLLTADTLDQMRARHPGLIAATVPDRGHVPFLDEPPALDVIRQILEAAQ